MGAPVRKKSSAEAEDQGQVDFFGRPSRPEIHTM
jgi:hypothetical protein